MHEFQPSPDKVPQSPPMTACRSYHSVQTQHAYGESVRLHCAQVGDPLAKPLLIVHGAGHTLHTFDNVVPNLSQFMSVVAYDLRGHGKSEHNIADMYTHEQYVADMADLIRAQSFEPPVIVASSIASLHALQLAAKEPDLVRAVVLIDLLPEVREKTINGLRKFFQMGPFDSYEDLVEKYKFLSAGMRNSEDIAEELVHATTLDRDGRCRFSFDQRIIDIVGTEFLAQFNEVVPDVTCPLLFVRGERSGVVPDGAVKRFRARLPESTRFDEVSISNGGHCPWRENPGQFILEVRQFLKKLG